MITHFFVFDVESVGLHGEAYAVAGVVIDGSGTEHLAFKMAVNPAKCEGEDGDRKWIAENVPFIEVTHQESVKMRDSFWSLWLRAKGDYPGIVMASECGWPVESRFLNSVIDDARHDRNWDGPYPLHDVASVMLAAGMDPMATYDRLPNEEPKHCPLADSRQSARLLLEALNTL